MTAKRLKFKKGQRVWYTTKLCQGAIGVGGHAPQRHRLRATFLTKKGMAERVRVRIDEVPTCCTQHLPRGPLSWYVRPASLSPMDAITLLGEQA